MKNTRDEWFHRFRVSIRIALKKSGKTAEEVAESCGVTAEELSHYLRSQTCSEIFDSFVLERLLFALDLQVTPVRGRK